MKKYEWNISRVKVAVLYDKIRACGANKRVLVSSSNFQSGAIQYASKHGIALIQLTDADSIYETRSAFSMNNSFCSIKQKETSSYIGIMQTSDDSKVVCSYLNNMESKIKEFLVDTNT